MLQMAVDMDHLSPLRLLIVAAILISISCIAAILIAIWHISIGHITHLLI